MKRKPLALRLVCLALAALMLTGCSQVNNIMSQLSEYMPAAPKNQTISDSSKWINSSIDGSIDADTPTNLKDDFYTAVNRDFLLEPLPEDTQSVNGFTPASDQLQKNFVQLMTLSADDTTGADTAIVSEEALKHIQSLMATMIKMGTDSAARDAQGAQPVLPYLQHIEAISSMEELTEYLCSTDGKNPFQIQLATGVLNAPVKTEDENKYIVYIFPNVALSLDNSERYGNASGGGFAMEEYYEQELPRLLEPLGYSKDQVLTLLRRCFRFETKLAANIPNSFEAQETDYLLNNYHLYTREEMEALAGDYPIGATLDAYGLGDSDTFCVLIPAQLKQVGTLYREKNLEDIKAYLEINTLIQALPMLDTETSQQYAAFLQQINGTGAQSSNGTEEMDEETKAYVEQMTIFQQFIQPYLFDAFQQAYVAHFHTAQEKADIQEMTTKILEAFRDVVRQADWMGDETRQEALEKLDCMGLHILYPDKLIDYSPLSFDDCHSFLDCVAVVNQFQSTLSSVYVNQDVDKSDWDLTQFATIDINAYYSPQDNTINILAGLLSGGNFYDPDRPMEENLAQLGTVIGHEMTHGFDTTGYMFDKYGNHRIWWTDEDRLAFDNRALNLIRYYSSLTPVPNAGHLDGNNVSGEAIADMGGMKLTLAVAQSMPDFDYDLYFRSYATMWRQHDTYFYEMQISADEHPLAMLRTNVTVSQFEQFQKTYNIQPGDGMYLAPEDRILVW